MVAVVLWSKVHHALLPCCVQELVLIALAVAVRDHRGSEGQQGTIAQGCRS